MEEISRRGFMLVLSSPSGAGKTTLSRLLLQNDPKLTLSVSVTTRSPRVGEVEGEDYYFADKNKFNQMIEAEAFLEYASVFDNFYGTPKDFVNQTLEAGNDVLFDIDWQGTQQIAQTALGDLVSVFILPPSVQELEHRLIKRAQDSDEVIKKRMDSALNEMSHWAEYKYVIVNHDLVTSLAQLESIVKAERLQRRRQTGLSTFVKSLFNEKS